MTRAIRIARFGGPEVLEFDTVDVGEPGPQEVRLRQTAVGLNFIDVYERTGLYSNPLPCGLGREAAGIVEAVGSRVRDVRVGDRVAYVLAKSGAYAEARLVPADRLVKIPNGVSDEVAAAVMLKGLTAQFLLRRTYRVRKGDFVLIHAAAGGVGSIAVQWARHLGARVIGVVGSEPKAELARSRGAEHVVLADEDLVERVRAITRGQGVAVVYDSVGKDTFTASLDCLRPLGMMVTYGNASGPVPPIAPLELSKRGSLFLTRPTLFHYIARRADLVKGARELFDLLERGTIQAHIGQRYPLADVAEAHRDLEARRTTGSTVLLP
ncbi:MAG TPA: quinone oxidoreductase [Steroidobacteraceae bacterium]|nr:quinone oxidoreductase [Steroidobacteraceae bacterium]